VHRVLLAINLFKSKKDKSRRQGQTKERAGEASSFVDRRPQNKIKERREKEIDSN